MAGGWGHITVDTDAGDNRFRGWELLDNGGDFAETVEQLYGMVMHLSDGEPARIREAERAAPAALRANDARRR